MVTPMELNDLIGALENEGWHKQPNIDDLSVALARLVGDRRQYIDLRIHDEGHTPILNVGVGEPEFGNIITPRYMVIAVDTYQDAARIIWAVTGSLEKLIHAEVCRQVATAEHALYRRP